MDLRSVMTANPACCTQGTTLQEAAKLMKDNDCGQIPVIDGARQPLGVITDRDIAIRAVAGGCDPSSATVGDYMTSPVATVPEDCSLEEACNVMEQHKIRRVLVVDSRGGVAGIVAQADVARSGKAAQTAEVVKEVSEPGKH
jgi:CBS domain-containing protein